MEPYKNLPVDKKVLEVTNYPGLFGFNRLVTTTIGNSVTTSQLGLFFADAKNVEDETDLRALALEKSLPTHHVCYIEEQTDADEVMGDVTKCPVESLNTERTKTQSITSIDMDVVDELLPIEDSSNCHQGIIISQIELNPELNLVKLTACRRSPLPPGTLGWRPRVTRSRTRRLSPSTCRSPPPRRPV